MRGEPTPPVRSKAELWLVAFVGFYRPAVAEVRRLDPVSKFLYAAGSVILVLTPGRVPASRRRRVGRGGGHRARFGVVLTGTARLHLLVPDLVVLLASGRVDVSVAHRLVRTFHADGPEIYVE